jgi:hypothetical protein
MAGESSSEKQQAIQRAARELEIEPRLLTARQLPNDFFRSWTLWRVEDDTMPPAVAMVATRGSDAQVLKLEDGFGALVKSEPVRLAGPDEALRYVKLLLTLTRPLVDEIPGISDANRAAWKDRIVPPTAKAAGGGYEVGAWLLDEGHLVQARFGIDPAGKVASDLKTVARDIGVSITDE